MDDFEQLLKSQPVRAMPAAWRHEILAAAQPAAKAPARPSIWQAWFWPSPYAWGGLAAVWVVILGLNIAAQPRQQRGPLHAPVLAQQEIYAMLTERNRLFAQFQPSVTVRAAVSPPPVPHKDSTGAWLRRRDFEISELA